MINACSFTHICSSHISVVLLYISACILSALLKYYTSGDISCTKSFSLHKLDIYLIIIGYNSIFVFLIESFDLTNSSIVRKLYDPDL